MEKDILIKNNASSKEITQRDKFYELFTKAPIPKEELLSNLALFMKRQDLSSILFMVELYKQIVNTHGVMMEFGVRWGRNLALYESLRGIFEPFNHNRKIIGFDTFEGFPAIDAKDGESSIIQEGAYNVTENYEEYLQEILNYHENESPIANIKKYELRKGDASIEIEKYLNENPQTIIAYAYFDFDIYLPTKKCLEAIKPHLTKGSVLGFDELNHFDYPGETIALKEVFGLDKYSIKRSPFSPTQSYIVIE